MLILNQLAEDRINKAIAGGEFDNLRGQGEPLILEDYSHVPEDLRMAYKIMKNAGMTPPVLEIRKEINELHHSLIIDKNEKTRTKTLNKLHCLLIKLEMNSQRYTNLILQQAYYEKLSGRFSQ